MGWDSDREATVSVPLCLFVERIVWSGYRGARGGLGMLIAMLLWVGWSFGCLVWCGEGGGLAVRYSTSTLRTCVDYRGLCITLSDNMPMLTFHIPDHQDQVAPPNHSQNAYPQVQPGKNPIVC